MFFIFISAALILFFYQLMFASNSKKHIHPEVIIGQQWPLWYSLHLIKNELNYCSEYLTCCWVTTHSFVYCKVWQNHLHIFHVDLYHNFSKGSLEFSITHTHMCTHIHTHSQLLFKAAEFGLAVCQLECQTLGWLLAVTTQGRRSWVSLGLPLPTQLCHPLGWRGGRETER